MSNLNELHKDHVEWLSQMDFFQDEIKFFQNKLFRAILDDEGSIINEGLIAEYRELFFLTLKRIDDIRHDILAHEQMIKREGRENFESPHDHESVAQHVTDMETNFMELRKRFKSFAAHHMH